jgi:hypothetical protein
MSTSSRARRASFRFVSARGEEVTGVAGSEDRRVGPLVEHRLAELAKCLGERVPRCRPCAMGDEQRLRDQRVQSINRREGVERVAELVVADGRHGIDREPSTKDGERVEHEA